VLSVVPVYELNGVSITRGSLPLGVAGTRKTLAMMQRLAQDGAKQLPVREAAISIVRDSGVSGHDRLGALRALFEFVRDRIYFVGDVAGVETLQSPRYTLSIGAGDCDDRSTLLAALARAIGIPVRFRVIAANRSRPSQFSHVYLVAQVGGRDVPMDTTYPNTPLGWQFPGPMRVGDFPA
jgi:transglutaminase-like putative cysteine protease